MTVDANVTGILREGASLTDMVFIWHFRCEISLLDDVEVVTMASQKSSSELLSSFRLTTIDSSGFPTISLVARPENSEKARLA